MATTYETLNNKDIARVVQGADVFAVVDPTALGAEKDQGASIGQIVAKTIRRNTTVLIGDSWINLETQSTESSSGRGIFNNINMMLNSPFSVVNVAGGSGDTLSQIAARFDTDVIPFNPAYVFILGGINDITAGTTATAMFDATKSMIDKSMANGILALVVPCQLMQGVWGVTANDQNANIKVAYDYNRMLQEHSTQTDGFIFFGNAWDTILDQTFVTGQGVYAPTAHAEYSLDGVHINMAGALRVARTIVDTIVLKFETNDPLPNHDADTASAGWNPYYLVGGTQHGNLGPGTSFTGTTPDAWYGRVQSGTVSTAVMSLVPRTDIKNAFFWNLVVNDLDGGGSLGKIQCIESDGAPFTYKYHLLSDKSIVVGDLVVFFGEIAIQGVTGTPSAEGLLNSFTLITRLYDSGNLLVATLISNINGGSTENPYIGSDFNGELMTIASTRYTIPAGAVKFVNSFEISTQNGGTGTTSFTADIGRCGVIKA